MENFVNEIIEAVESDYETSSQNVLREARAWDICYKQFYNAITNNTINTDHLALHLTVYLANWGMYRGSSFVKNYNYRLHIPAVKIITDPQYKQLLGIDISDYDDEKLDLLDDLVERLKDYYEEIRGKKKSKISQTWKMRQTVPQIRGKKKSKISQTLITKILLGTLGCVPAYDRYFCKGIGKHKIANQTFGRKSILSLQKFYNENKGEFEICRKNINNLEDLNIPYPTSKILDMFFFAAGRD